MIARTVGLALALHALFTVAVPWFLLKATSSIPGLWVHIGPLRWLGLPLAALGLYLYVSMMAGLLRRGTSAIPGRTPTTLVTTGWHARVRHPLLLGVVTILLGEAVVSQSVALLAYALAYWVWLHLFVTWWEEPKLRATFGEAWSSHAARVPRWIPRTGPRGRGRGDHGNAG